MPLVNEQIDVMDEARLEFIHKINDHIMKLREELRISELLMHSVIKSLSVQSEETVTMDRALEAARENSAQHRPMVISEHRQAALAQIEDALQDTTKKLNNH